MNRASRFLQWIEENFPPLEEFRLIYPGELPFAQHFDISLRRTGSLMKGNQWYLFKEVPWNLTQETANQLAFERTQLVKEKGKILKGIVDIMVFIYVSEKTVPSEVLECLGNFHSIKKSLLRNVHEINLFFNVGTGEYFQPQKIGFTARLPIMTLLKETRQFIFEPYKKWLQSGEQIASFCRKCGQENPGKYNKFCGKCGESLVL
ncbi:MAG: zinc ribbon domain-containing protein [Promethearchaeota archaeon]